MTFKISNATEHILMLGAGSSVDYGLPVWRDLDILIRKKINEDLISKYQYKKEILEWLDKVGEDKEHATIDVCIKEESVSSKYHLNGHEIENQIFLIMKDIFEDAYKDNNKGWIRILNEKILSERDLNLSRKLSFVNYNYDDVLDRNFLNFSYLPLKHQIFNHKDSLKRLPDIYVGALFPHGNFFAGKESGFSSRLYKSIRTMKTDNEGYIDAVSCYESEYHTVSNNHSEPLKLYILGLGGGLEVNLNNIDLDFRISEVHVTIKNSSLKDKIINFLSDKYNLHPEQIKVYENCAELIQKCF